MLRKEDPISNKKLRRAVMKACKSVEKMIREEPHLIVISDGSSRDSGSTVKEIAKYLFHRRQGDGS